MRRPDRRRARRSRPAFTLVEVLVALVVGAAIVLGARMMIEGVADGARRVAREAQDADREANAERVLRGVVATLEVSEAAGRSFGGSEHEAHFTSWCDTPGGWQEPCAVTLAVRPGDGSADRPGSALVLTLGGGTRLSIRAGFAYGELRYLADPRGDGEWFSSWEAGLTVPVAIGAILDRDTLIFTVGVRG